jgi:hypothetical protein
MIVGGVNWGNGKAFFFKGGLYFRYDIKADKVDPGYPKAIDNSTWPGLPWKDGFDAVVNWGNGKAYFFKGDRYVSYDIKTDKVDPGYPKPIDNSTWPGKAKWGEGFDAAVNWGNGKAYFFKGGQYISYDIKGDKVDPGYPKDIDNSTWPGLPWRDGISAVTVWDNGKAFFFRGSEYVRFDLKANRVDPGYPKRVDGTTWPGLE